jgi:cysteine synthase B
MNILKAIGNTPLVELKNIYPGNKNIKIFGKLEACNPGGSIKDRTALYMIEGAEKRGELSPRKMIIEATSGNTGIALAMISAIKGYRIRLYMPETASVERINIIKAHGADVCLTPTAAGTDGAIEEVESLYQNEKEKYFWPNQFANPDNILAHSETTGPEIWKQTGGDFDAVIAGLGTTGTIMGISRFLKEKRHGAKIIGVEPTAGHKIQGLKNLDESKVPLIYDLNCLDEKITVGDEEAFEKCRLLAKKEGLLLGMSSGAAVAAALKFAEKIERAKIVVILPDRGDRYLSTCLFKPVCPKCPRPAAEKL